MVWDGEYWITRLGIIKDHMTPFLANELISNFTEGLDSTPARDVGKCPHFRKPRQVCLQNIPEQVQLEYVGPFPWQRESIHELPRGYYEAHPLWFFPETDSPEAWGIQQHSPGNRSHMLIQHEISSLSPPLHSITFIVTYVKYGLFWAHFQHRQSLHRQDRNPNANRGLFSALSGGKGN